MSNKTRKQLPVMYWHGKEVNDKRQRILACAQEIFSEEGFRSAEVKQIASKAGVGKATIYKYFDSKEALLLAIVEENLEHVRDLVLAELVGPGDSLEKFEAASLAIANYLENNRQFARVLIQEAGDFMGEIQTKHLDIIEQSLPLADAFFSSMREEGYFQALPTRDIIQLLVNQLIGATYTWALTGKGSLTKNASNHLHILVEGLRAKPKSRN